MTLGAFEHAPDSVLTFGISLALSGALPFEFPRNAFSLQWLR
jgi:hypothetical protein